MNFSRIAIIGLSVIVLNSRVSAAQTASSSRVFVDASAMVERDPTEFFNGSDTGPGGRGAIGLPLSEWNGLRFEVDVPRWRTAETVSASPVYCAESAGCVGGVGFVPARTTSQVAVRTVSYSFLYARALPRTNRVQVSLVAGGSIESRAFKSSGTFDELGADGRVVRHTPYSSDSVKDWPAIVVGVDTEVLLTPHFAVVPQLRFHTFPYPRVSIVQPGVALRWRF